MIIRSFVADSVATALKEVRSQMGGNAVVLKTRQLSGRNADGKYEVTACLDNPTTEQAGKTLTDRKATVAAAVAAEQVPSRKAVSEKITAGSAVEERLASLEEKLDRLLQAQQVSDSSDDEPSLMDKARAALRRADVPEEWITRLVDNLEEDSSDGDMNEAIIRSGLEKMVSEIVDPTLEFKAGDRVLFVGPAGAGKTSAIGKLAAHLVMKKKLAVKLVTLDNSNIGAFDEIASYGELLGVDVTNPTFGNVKAEDSCDTDKVVLIDTGIVPVDDKGLKAFTQQIDKLNPTHRLAVFSALTRSSDIVAFGRSLQTLQPSHLVFTMTDLTGSWGGMLAAAESTGLKLSLSANAPSGSGSLEKPDVAAIVACLLNREDENE